MSCSGGGSGDQIGALPAQNSGDEVPQVLRSVIEIENAKPGTHDWKLSNPAQNHEIEGYASLTSVNRGGSIDLYVNTSSSTYNIDIYRMGYYGGAGARLMQSLPNFQRQPQVVPCLSPNNVIECNWSVSHQLTIPAAENNPESLNYWASGIYLAKLSANTAPAKESYIIFVVRDDERPATYVSQLPVTTYQAYNFWGGKSLYTGCEVQEAGWRCADGARQSNAVSFNRPYGRGANPASAAGVGAGEFITNVQPARAGYEISNAAWDYNMVRWMEKQGYDLKYITNLDLHENSAVLQKTKAFISTGHDEYYSKPMWDRLVSAKLAGINLAFFSANQIYWQVRFNDGVYGSSKKNRTMICYRAGGDPVTDNNLTTNQFRYLGRPEAGLIGNQYIKDPIVGDVTLSNASHWLFSGTGASKDTVLKGLLGYEINAHVADISPPQTKILAHSVSNGYASHITYYVDASSAQVFATGTMQWSWGLDNFIPNNLRSDYTDPIAQRFSANLFNAIGENNLLTLTHVASSLQMNTPAGDLSGGQVILDMGPVDRSKTNQWRFLLADQEHFQIVSRANGLCLQTIGTTSGARTGSRDCNGADNQKWKVREAGSGTINLLEKSSGLCLGMPNSAGAGVVLTVSTCDNSQHQLWRRANL